MQAKKARNIAGSEGTNWAAPQKRELMAPLLVISYLAGTGGQGLLETSDRRVDIGELV